MAAWRNRIGAPSLVTTRSPRAALPRVRPRHRVSKAMKYPSHHDGSRTSTMVRATQSGTTTSLACPSRATANSPARMPATTTTMSIR